MSSTTTRLRPALALVAATAALLAGCSSGTTGAGSGTDAAQAQAGASAAGEQGGASVEEVLEREGLADLDGKAAVDRLDALPVAERPADLMASVRVDELVYATESGEETSVPLPQEEFYVSFAPYAEQTHECFYHALTSCVGEYFNEEATVSVLDANGDALVQETVTTFDNGFIGLWLPRDLEGATLNVEIDGKTGSVPLGTTQEDPTCVTTLQVA